MLAVLSLHLESLAGSLALPRVACVTHRSGCVAVVCQAVYSLQSSTSTAGNLSLRVTCFVLCSKQMHSCEGVRHVTFTQ